MPSALAQEKLAAKARRVRLLRRRVVAVTLATFALAWGVVAFDGSMGTTTTVAATGTTSTEPTATPSPASSATTSPSADESGASGADDAAALTTSQS